MTKAHTEEVARRPERRAPQARLIDSREDRTLRRGFIMRLTTGKHTADLSRLPIMRTWEDATVPLVEVFHVD